MFWVVDNFLMKKHRTKAKLEEREEDSRGTSKVRYRRALSHDDSESEVSFSIEVWNNLRVKYVILRGPVVQSHKMWENELRSVLIQWFSRFYALTNETLTCSKSIPSQIAHAFSHSSISATFWLDCLTCWLPLMDPKLGIHLALFWLDVCVAFWLDRPFFVRPQQLFFSLTAVLWAIGI